jgi:hypothetical protein
MKRENGSKNRIGRTAGLAQKSPPSADAGRAVKTFAQG